MRCLQQPKRTRVEEDEPVSANQVNTTSTGLATQEEDELLAVGVVKLVDQLLTLVDRLRAVQAEVPVPRTVTVKSNEYRWRNRRCTSCS